MIYVLITLVVLLFLNLYSTRTIQTLFYKSKQASMMDKLQLVSTEINRQEVLNTDAVAEAISSLDSLRVTRLLVSDPNGVAVYDSMDGAAVGQYILYPDIVTALEGNDMFSWQYRDSVMTSQAAAPLMDYDQLVGCVYMMESDSAQGALINSLQNNILSITVGLELVVLLFSLLFSRAFSRRLRRVMSSMRVIREGDYSHRVVMGGHDELTVLGQEFNDLTERLQDSEQTLRQFVSDASHELKTPLASIKLLADSILQNQMDRDTICEFVGDIGNEADRLTRMSEKLLSLSKMDSQDTGEYEITYIAPTVERVAKMLASIASQAQVRIVPQLEQDCSVLIMEDDLYQILFNLAENGIKYNRPGGTLTIRLERQADNAVLQVIDTGMGIPEASIGHIFERFYRVDKARSRQSGGSGLGLAIVHSMVLRNRGQIHVESALGAGTVFTVTFPIFDVEEDCL